MLVKESSYLWKWWWVWSTSDITT